MANRIETIGVLTSGGDAPGMNAALRAVVRTALSRGLEVKGIRRGFHGLLKGELFDMNSHDVCGGTILQTARSGRMHEEAGQKLSAEQ